MRARRRLAIALLAMVGLGGCAVDGLAFVQDDRVEITVPTGGETVRLPFDFSWKSRGFEGTYAVFFDRSPMRPNRDLLSLVDDRDPCRALPGCPTANWLADRDIYVTQQSSVRVERLPDYRREDRGRDRHTATLVLLGPDGRRLGESAFVVEFFVERDGR